MRAQFQITPKSEIGALLVCLFTLSSRLVALLVVRLSLYRNTENIPSPCYDPHYLSNRDADFLIGAAGQSHPLQLQQPRTTIFTRQTTIIWKAKSINKNAIASRPSLLLSLIRTCIILRIVSIHIYQRTILRMLSAMLQQSPLSIHRVRSFALVNLNTSVIIIGSNSSAGTSPSLSRNTIKA